jgi:hypothetical protein
MGIGIFAYTQGYFDPLLGFFAEPGQPVDVAGVELSRFTGTAVKEDAVATALSAPTVYIWCDWNGDGQMQRSAFAGYSSANGLIGGEVEETAASTLGVFTSPSEYPIGMDIWLFVDDGAETYCHAYHKFQMTGSPHADGTAKSIGNVYVRLCDDAVTWSGLVRGVSIDDGTDYNYTLSGTTGLFEARATLATSDAGILSDTDPAFYDGTGPYVHWGSGKEFAPNFFGFYLTNQDGVDLGLDSGDFDFYYEGVTNTYCAIYLDNSDPAIFYDSDDDAALVYTFDFDVDISAAGCLLYIGIYQQIEWDDFIRGSWSEGTDANNLGTNGADWDWVA